MEENVPETKRAKRRKETLFIRYVINYNLLGSSYQTFTITN